MKLLISMTTHTATISSKAQVTIPALVRDALGLAAGDKIDFVPTERGFEIVARRESVMSLHGKYAHLVPARKNRSPASFADMDEAIRNRMRARFAK